MICKNNPYVYYYQAKKTKQKRKKKKTFFSELKFSCFLQLKITGKKSILLFFLLFGFQVVFVPLWIILTLLSVCVLYYIIWALLFMRSPEITNTQRHGHLVNSFMSCFIIVPLLTFMV